MKTIGIISCLTLAIGCRSKEPPAHKAGSGAAPLVELSTSLEALRSEFNAHEQEARFLTLLSPT